MVEELVEQANEDRREELSEEARDNKLTEDNLDEWIQTQSGHTGGLYPYLLGPAPVTPSDFVEDEETCGVGTTLEFPPEFFELIEKRDEQRRLLHKYEAEKTGIQQEIDGLLAENNILRDTRDDWNVTVDFGTSLGLAQDTISIITAVAAVLGPVDEIGIAGLGILSLAVGPELAASYIDNLLHFVNIDTGNRIEKNEKIKENNKKIRELNKELNKSGGINDYIDIYQDNIDYYDRKLKNEYPAWLQRYGIDQFGDDDLSFGSVD